MPETLTTRWSESLHGSTSASGFIQRSRCLISIYPADRLGQIVHLDDAELVIGRDPGCGLELPDDSVSRRHAVLRPLGDGFVIVDLASTNGTYVNDVRIESRTLESGDRIRVGNQIFKYISADRFEAEYFENSYRMMTTDGLTQAYNKRYFLEVAERELQRSGRTSRPLSLLMLDIDHFKQINDQFGHMTGDEVLIEISRRLRSTLRGDEVFARYGGEEFCLLLPDTALAESLQVAERMRSAVSSTEIVTEHASLPVTLSIGATCTQDDATLNTAQLIERADRNLYTAKHAGRNRIVG
jgi:diguanylate cyclase (GGDEF)-like protein